MISTRSKDDTYFARTRYDKRKRPLAASFYGWCRSGLIRTVELAFAHASSIIDISPSLVARDKRLTVPVSC
jgi:hypothetical protein